MKFRQTNSNKLRVNPGPRLQNVRRRCAGFTLAEVLAALLFMAIVIPVSVQGVLVASRASAVAQRKTVAARIAERLLNEMIVTGQTRTSTAAQSGVIEEGDLQYRYRSKLDFWTQYSTGLQTVTMQILTVEVSFAVQGQDYSVQLSTLVAPGTLL
ncbi:MAG: type II secretion system protein [Verrucomicrobiota bacterium]|nr:type II secretion system protein [Verrucomicrobiota bacterium]